MTKRNKPQKQIELLVCSPEKNKRKACTYEGRVTDLRTRRGKSTMGNLQGPALKALIQGSEREAAVSVGAQV